MQNGLALVNLVFVSFGQYVTALDRRTGVTIWTWTAPHGKDYATVLVDGNQLIVSVMGYTYAINPLTGETLWENRLPGLGTGVACIASVHGHVNAQRPAEHLAEQQRQAQRQQQQFQTNTTTQ
jgi:hypothetical protein